MSKVFVLILAFSLLSCATGIELAGQNLCNDKSEGAIKEDCGNARDVIEAMESDLEFVGEISGEIRNAYSSQSDHPIAAHERQDSGLCEGGRQKICSANKGCFCE